MEEAAEVRKEVRTVVRSRTTHGVLQMTMDGELRTMLHGEEVEEIIGVRMQGGEKLRITGEARRRREVESKILVRRWLDGVTVEGQIGVTAAEPVPGYEVR